QEGDDLVADVGGVQGGAVGRVTGGEHQPEQVLGRALVRAGAGGDDVVHDPGEVVGVRAEGGVGGGVVLARGAGAAGHGPLQAAHSGRGEGGGRGPPEGAEVVAEPGGPDGVEGQAGHVVGDVHRLSVTGGAVPGVDEPAGPLQHHRVVGPHRAE